MTNRQQKALAALIRAPTIEAAAETAGVGYSTVRKWLKSDPEFRAAYRRELDELLQDASAQSRKNLSAALDVLADVMQHGENSQTRIGAAKAVLEYSLKLNEALDVQQRMAAIEETIRELEEGR